MSAKRKRNDQRAERESLATKIDSFGDTMPVPCTEFTRLKRAIDQTKSEEQMVLDLLQKNMSRLQRMRKQRDLLRRRGSLMISKKAKTVEDLEEIERLEAARETRDAVDPESEGCNRHAKRLRGESSANTAAGPADVGSPGAGSTAPPETSEPVDFARMPAFWEVDPFPSEFDVSALDGLDFGGGIP
ncbi:uncharacterized protein K452DRAFT_303710 [Aplosporella prunicola CBS 121167]|uniref:Uncharacterized protein n=1 Tax=Aplosporella prunicola CBS 121167 TaxID=1176127 RepID=A0A6A6AXD0_9PEZI|nr:uncharacterized protein K452DRAFT_303710 [Aplosporella prunicola CBS 121167]KAF2135211.1 hypothetical protein K452DRAFT_303710 [Aplosporella prunicola CBS 121167]